MTEEWIKKVNEILRKHRFRQGETLVRFNATQFPFPTISIVVYVKGRKVFEKPIRFLSDFINDLVIVKEIIDKTCKEKPVLQTDKAVEEKPVSSSNSATQSDRFNVERD